MPWECCGESLADNKTNCPKCNKAQTVRSAKLDKTTRFQLAKDPEFALFTGATFEAAYDPKDEAQAFPPLRETVFVPVMRKTLALEFATRGMPPPPGHLVYLRVTPRKAKKPMQLTTMFSVNSHANSGFGVTKRNPA